MSGDARDFNNIETRAVSKFFFPATQKKLAYLGFQCIDYPSYSPDLAPLNYHLFHGLKKAIKRSPFFVRRGGHCCRGDLIGPIIF